MKSPNTPKFRSPLCNPRRDVSILSELITDKRSYVRTDTDVGVVRLERSTHLLEEVPWNQGKYFRVLFGWRGTRFSVRVGKRRNCVWTRRGLIPFCITLHLYNSWTAWTTDHLERYHLGPSPVLTGRRVSGCKFTLKIPFDQGLQYGDFINKSWNTRIVWEIFEGFMVSGDR